MLRRVITAAALLLATSLSALAEKPPVYVTGSVTMSSAYLWRGDRVCGLHFKPDVVLHVGNFALEQYSFLALDGSYKEIDWDLFYTFGPFSVHVADYYARYSDYLTEENFFSWRKGATNHIDEVAFTYSCPSFPLNVKWFTFFWGDWIPNDDGTPGSLSLSSYLELATYHSFEEYGTIGFNLGISVFRGAYTGYSKAFMPIHLELSYDKSLEVGSFSIPLRAFVVLNPYRRTLEAGASVGFAF